MKTFWAKSQNGLENDQKSTTFIDDSDMTFRHVEKPYKNQRKTRFLKSQKRVAEILIKPVENEDFGAPFPKMSLKMIKKHYPEKVSATCFQNVGNPCKTNETHCFSKAKNALRKPLLNLSNSKTFVPFFENDYQNDRESNG